MTITVTGKLNKSSQKKPVNGEGALFLVSIGKQEYNRQTKEKEWVNYSAALFAKGAQEAFYDKALMQGCIISVSGTGVLPKTWGEQNNIQLDIIDAKLEYAGLPSQQAPNQPAPIQQSPQPAPGGFDDFDDDIPF